MTPNRSITEEILERSRFLTVEQVAEELNVGVPLVRALLRSGELRGIQVGGRSLWRIGLADVEAFIQDAYRKTTEDIAASGAVHQEKIDGSQGSSDRIRE